MPPRYRVLYPQSRLNIGAHRFAGELLDFVDEPVARSRRAVLVTVREGARDARMQLCGERHVGALLVVDVPEAPRERVHEAHGPGGEVVVRGLRAERVELAVGAHEVEVVVVASGLLEAPGELAETLALLGRCAARGASRDQPLQLA